jgi:hypothetical protein
MAMATLTLLCFVPFFGNWTFLYGKWDDPPTGQEEPGKTLV